MHTPDHKKVIIGKFGKTFGVRGQIKIRSFTRPPENLLKFTTWFISADEKTWQEITPEKMVLQGTNIIAKLPAIDSPEAVHAYTNQLIAINRDQLPPLNNDEFYWDDLVGMKVINTQGITLGIVDSLVTTGANDVLVVKPATAPLPINNENTHAPIPSKITAKKQRIHARERFIPYLKHVVLKTDLTTGEIIVDWDEDF